MKFSSLFFFSRVRFLVQKIMPRNTAMPMRADVEPALSIPSLAEIVVRS